ncbi:MAG TPA: energy-coupling factor transporter ATPase, partial [Firmicutes bacterium]|nr:energy-coupling factor transporter ATPase [Bacillota bacterium]
MPVVAEGLTHVYLPGTAMEVVALADIDLQIRDGEFLGIIGPTGSGKSTLIQHFNGLLRPTRGRVVVDDIDLSDRRANLREVRRRVGLVFQYPEQQLFEETVGADVAFGPRNLGLSGAELERRVSEALAMVGLEPEVAMRSPFELSGGQMRRVAIAGVLAMGPRVLILDEPTAGLDPRGREEILDRVARLHREHGLTVVLVSHQMEDVARLAERVAVIHRGRLMMVGTPREVFAQAEMLEEVGLGVPAVTRLMRLLRQRGCPVHEDVVTMEEAEQEICHLFAAPSKGAAPAAGAKVQAGGPAPGG